MKSFEDLVVSAVLCGAVFAHEARKAGKSVLVIDKRPNVAENVCTREAAGPPAISCPRSSSSV